MRTPSKFVVVFLCMLAGFWAPAIGAAMEVVLPQIASTIAISGNAYNGILLAGSLVSAVCYFLIGHLSDRFGKKRLLFWGTLLTFVSVIICGITSQAYLLIIGNAAMSIGGAVLYVNALALGCSSFEQHASGKVIGLISAGIYAGRMLGPLLAGWLTAVVSWRWVFGFFALFGIVIFILLTKVKEQLPERKPEHLDWQGICIFGLGIVGFIYGFTEASSDIRYLFCSLIGIILFVIFVYWEKRVPNPILPMSLFRNRKLTLSLLTIVFSYAATYGISSLTSLYLQSGVGVSPKYAGLLLAILPFAQMLFSPWAGKAVDQSSARLVSTCGLFGAIAGLCLLLGISPDSSVWYYALAFLLMGISLAFIVTPNTQAVMTAIPREYLSLGSSMVGEFRNIGEASSIGIVNVILVMQLHYQLIGLATAEQLTNTFHITVVVFLLLACIAALCSLLRGK